MEKHECILAERIRALSAPVEPISADQIATPVNFSGIRCVLFDVYGTMFISASGDIHTAEIIGRQASLDAALNACGLAIDIKAERITHWIQQHHTKSKEEGIRYPEVDICALWQDVLGEAGISPLPLETLQKLVVEYEARVNPVWPMPGVWDALEELCRREIRMGIVSNAQFYTPLLFPAFAKKTVFECGFDALLCAWSYLYGEAKPATSLFQVVLDVLGSEGIMPDEVLYIGNDMRNDIWPASILGCRTALFAGDMRSLRLRKEDSQISNLKPDSILTAWSDLFPKQDN